MEPKDLTELAAWWGAIIATSVLVWDIYKWKQSGARVRVTVGTNMQMVGEGEPEDQTFVVVTAANTGDRPTTITHMNGKYYPSWLRQLLRKPDHQFFVPTPGYAPPLPYVLQPGERWSGTALQTEEWERLSRVGRLYLGITHTARTSSQLKRVIIPSEDEEKEEPPTGARG